MKKKIILIFLTITFIHCKKDSDLLDFVLFPTAAILVFPEANEECTAGTIISETESEVVFRWEIIEQGNRYEVSLTNLNTEENEVFSAEKTELPIRLSRGTPYSWYVTSIIPESENRIDSNVEVFYNAGPGLSSFIPFPAQLVAPVLNIQLSASQNTINLEWLGSDLDNDIKEYDVYFSESNPPVLFSAEITDAFLNDININAGTTYYWKIVTRDDLGNESSSKIFFFETLN